MGYEREMSARQKALELQKKRDVVEAEMDAIFSTLTAEGGPGLSGNLVDREGFPRADIDVHSVRTQRNRFALLKTDHKQICAEIEKYLHIALAPPSEGVVSSPSSEFAPAGSRNAISPTDEPVQTVTEVPASNTATAATDSLPPVPVRPAFALVDIISANSPAAASGLLVNDRIISFGAVSLRSFATPQLAMAALPGLLQEHENQPVDVVVYRGDLTRRQAITLSLTPRRWSGPGLLGCHIIPLEVSQLDNHYRPDVATAVMNRSSQETFRA